MRKLLLWAFCSWNLKKSLRSQGAAASLGLQSAVQESKYARGADERQRQFLWFQIAVWS